MLDLCWLLSKIWLSLKKVFTGWTSWCSVFESRRCIAVVLHRNTNTGIWEEPVASDVQLQYNSVTHTVLNSDRTLLTHWSSHSWLSYSKPGFASNCGTNPCRKKIRRHPSRDFCGPRRKRGTAGRSGEYHRSVSAQTVMFVFNQCWRCWLLIKTVAGSG